MTDQLKLGPLTPFIRAGSIAIAFLASGASIAHADVETGAQKGALTVQIEVERPDGVVMIALYADAGSYSGGQPLTGRRVPVDGQTASVTFGDLPYGRYAIKAFHDLDGDGKLTTNPFGAPVEPFAFSTGAKAHYGPPEFDAAAVTITSPETKDVLSFLP